MAAGPNALSDLGRRLHEGALLKLLEGMFASNLSKGEGPYYDPAKAAKSHRYQQRQEQGEKFLRPQRTLAEQAWLGLEALARGIVEPVDPSTGMPNIDVAPVNLVAKPLRSAVDTVLRLRREKLLGLTERLENASPYARSINLSPLGAAFADADYALAQIQKGLRKDLSKDLPQDDTFFSPVRRAFEGLRTPEHSKVGGPEQVLTWLQRQPGIKKEEVEWLGLEGFLRENPKATKRDVLNWVDKNQVEVVEYLGGIKGGRSSWGRKPDSPPNPEYASSAYTLPGGSNYRELVFTWGNKPAGRTRSFEEWLAGQRENLTPMEGGDFRGAEGEIYTPQQVREYYLDQTRGDRARADFSGRHFPQPNQLAHARLTDRTLPDGRKVLFVEEIQSDWQKALRGQEKAMRDPASTWEAKAAKILKEKGLEEYAPVVPRAVNEGDLWAISPNAPLVRDYHELAMKRILKIAAKEGYDAVGWTTGAQQAARNSAPLIKGVGRVEYKLLTKQIPKGSDASGTFTTYDKLGKELDSRTVFIRALPQWVGLEAAEKLVRGLEKGPVRQTWRRSEGWGLTSKSEEAINVYQPTSTLPVQDLIVGERGYSLLYDQQIPRAAEKFGRGKVTQEEIVTDRPSPVSSEPNWRIVKREPIHLLDIRAQRPTLQKDLFPLFELGAGAAVGASLLDRYRSQRRKQDQERQ